MNDNKIEQKILDIEGLIAGGWQNPDNNSLWQFSKIGKDERRGTVTLTDGNISNPGSIRLQYEVIWVNDDQIYINVIHTSFPKTDQLQIWITKENLRIAYPNYSNLQIEEILLNRV